MSVAIDFQRMVLEFMRDDPLTVTYIKQSTAAYNPATGENSFLEETREMQALLMDMTPMGNGLSAKFNTEILAGDKELYMKPPDLANEDPLVIDTTSDRVMVGSVVYKVQNMKEVNPSAAQPLLYVLHIRR